MTRTTFNGFYLAMLSVTALSGNHGNHKIMAETVRRLEKPSLQPLEINIKSVSDSFSCYTGVFQAPLDTTFKYDGNSLEVTSTWEKNEFEASMINNNKNWHQWLTLTSNSARENIKLLPNLNHEPRSQSLFFESSCEVGIEKFERKNLTQYIAKVRNCADKENLLTYFTVHLRKSNVVVRLVSRDLDALKDDRSAQYLKYVNLFYTKEEKDVFHANLNFPAMEADNVHLDVFGFVIYTSTSNYYDRKCIVARHSWFYQI